MVLVSTDATIRLKEDLDSLTEKLAKAGVSS